MMTATPSAIEIAPQVRSTVASSQHYRVRLTEQPISCARPPRAEVTAARRLPRPTKASAEANGSRRAAVQIVAELGASAPDQRTAARQLHWLVGLRIPIVTRVV